MPAFGSGQLGGAGVTGTMTLKVPGEAHRSRPWSPAPAVGTQPFAVRFTANAGRLEGFEVTMVTVAVNDVVVAVTVINGTA